MTDLFGKIHRERRCPTCNARHDSEEYALCQCHAGRNLTDRRTVERMAERARRHQRDEALRRAVRRKT